MTITIGDTKKSVYILNSDKTTGDISSIVIPHDFAIGVDGLSKSLVVHGTARFEGDVQIIGTLHGGSPVKIAGGISVEGGANFDGVDVGASVADVPDIKSRIGVVELDYMQSKDLDSTISSLANDKASSFGTKMKSLQPKSSMSAYTKTSALDTKISTYLADPSSTSGAEIALLQPKSSMSAYTPTAALDATISSIASNKTSSFGSTMLTLQPKSSMSAYTKTSKLDTKISTYLTDPTSTSGAEIALLQTKADLTSDVESMSSYTTMQSELSTTKSDLTTLNSSLSTSSFKTGMKPALVSDRRLKKEIEEIKDPFVVINNLKPVTYSWNENALKLSCYDEDVHFGFIAQDIQNVLPTLVSEPDRDGNLSIKANSLEIISVLVSAVQDQQKQIQELKSKVLELENNNI